MKTKGLNLWTFVSVWLGLATVAVAQTAGTVHPNFAPTPGADSQVRGVARQLDGRLIVVGQFTTFNGTARSRIARVNYDGSLDTTFNPGTGAGGSINAAALLPDGGVVVGGTFPTFDDRARANVARLSATGSLVLTYAPVVNGIVESVVVQADGKVLLGGRFTMVNGVSRNRVARLNDDGSLDTTFDPGAGVNDTVMSLALQADGRVLMAGSFTTVAGTARNRVARLNSNGSLDTTFVSGAPNHGVLNFVTVANDGKIVVGGSTDFSNSTGLARLNANGSVDTTFSVGNNGINSVVVSGAVQPDGKILISGYFTAVRGVTRNRIARLNPNGTLDTTFDPGAGANDTAWCMILEPEGSILLGGAFTSYGGVARSRVTRIHNIQINRPPIFTTPATASVLEDAANHLINVTGITAGIVPESGQSVTNLTVTSSDPALLPHPVVAYTSGAATATLALSPAANLRACLKKHER